MLFLCSCALVFSNYVAAQDDTGNFVTEINEQVWKPFKQAYEARDAALFNSLHTVDALRITEGGITPGPEYKARIIEGFKRTQDYKIKIDFAHEHRLFYGDLAYEVGYYKMTSSHSGQTDSNSYGRFHVMLRRIDGKWMIAQDWDTEMVGSHRITEADFNSATPLSLD